MKKLLIFIFALLFILPAMAELITVSGTIKDDLGPLVGATVLVSGTSTGVATDTDGKFRIPNVASDAKIDISYIGYKKQTLSATDINASTPISLKEDAFEAGEVTVTGKYTQKPCTTDQLPTNAASGMTKLPPEGQSGLLCVIDKCNSGYDLDAEQNQCITISGPCTKLPIHAESGTRAWDTETNQEICVANSCNEGYKLSDGKCESELSEQESANKVSQLRDNAAAMKEKENSIANKLLGTAAIGAGGIGVSQLLSAQSEKNADADAERDMKAYLETFRCDFGQGRNIRGGAKDLVLPGGNELMPLYTEYKALAAELKTTKNALGIKPGIEAETIFDKADNGLYDNESIGRQSGAYSSLSRALSDAAGTDSAILAEQKRATASKATTGMVVAGVGIVGGAVGNLLINKDAPKESSEKINKKYSDASNQSSKDADTKIPDAKNDKGLRAPTAAI